MNAAPMDEKIVAYGGLESPWPVPGSVLVAEGAAYFAAGRQSFADGGILIFKVDPPSGKIHWVQRLDSVPQKGFYDLQRAGIRQLRSALSPGRRCRHVPLGVRPE